MNSREEIATFLFNGDKEKAEKLLLLIDSPVPPVPPEFSNLKMELPESACRWCTSDGECLFCMPDSLFMCKGKCHDFEEAKND